MIRATISLALCAIALSGCATTREERLAALQGQCAAYGFTQGTDAFASCVQRADIAERERDAVEGAAMTVMGAQMIANGAPRTYGPSMTTCTYRPFGNSVSQTCM